MGENKGIHATAKEDSAQTSLELYPIPPPADPPNKRKKLILWGLRYGAVVIVVAGALLGAMIAALAAGGAVDAQDEEEANKYKTQNLLTYLFMWLFITWLGACFVDIFIMAMPYLFRVVARYVNPAHHRYWRIWRVLRKPITALGTQIIGLIAFYACINLNDDLYINDTKEAGAWHWDDVVADVLEQMTFAVVAYCLIKFLVLYMGIHYHTRSNQGRITHSKELYSALATLYDASLYANPKGSPQFKVEDTLISSPSSNIASKMQDEKDAGEFLGRVGFRGAKKARYFGDDTRKDHWFGHGSSYGVVQRALANPKSAAALATRIWRSLVADGEDAMKASDIEEVLGPYRSEESKRIFAAIDENESKDIKLEEMVWTSIEAGRIRADIYKGMTQIDHCLNTFEWILIGSVTAVMTYFILLLYVETLKQLQQTASTIVVGLGFAFGRTIHKFLTGCIFVFFEHPFDIGDRVQVYNMASTASVSCVVKHQSLLYTVFQRLDTQQLMQITNERLQLKRIENVTRSGNNRESRSIFVDIKTTFVDIMHLRTEMEAFLKANPRDYMPNLAINLIEIFELNKMELRVAWIHKNNWSNEPLRAKRSGRFMCALIAACRKVPIQRPGGTPLGTESRPYWTAKLDTPDALNIVAKAQAKASSSRIDSMTEHMDEETRRKNEKESNAQETLTKIPVALLGKKEISSTGVDLDGIVGDGVVGMRNKQRGGSGLYYP